jgi:hypothetical protein
MHSHSGRPETWTRQLPWLERLLVQALDWQAFRQNRAGLLSDRGAWGYEALVQLATDLYNLNCRLSQAQSIAPGNRCLTRRL